MRRSLSRIPKVDNISLEQLSSGRIFRYTWSTVDEKWRPPSLPLVEKNHMAVARESERDEVARISWNIFKTIILPDLDNGWQLSMRRSSRRDRREQRGFSERSSYWSSS